jgi:hypothetical protein
MAQEGRLAKIPEKLERLVVALVQERAGLQRSCRLHTEEQPKTESQKRKIVGTKSRM